MVLGEYWPNHFTDKYGVTSKEDQLFDLLPLSEAFGLMKLDYKIIRSISLLDFILVGLSDQFKATPHLGTGIWAPLVRFDSLFK